MNNHEFMKYVLYENNKDTLENIYILIKNKKITLQFLNLVNQTLRSEDDFIFLYEKGEKSYLKNVLSSGKFGLINRCRYTGKEVDIQNFDIVEGYWTPFTVYVCDKNFKQKCKSEEAYECQKIDHSCNDCKFFNRINQHTGLCAKKQIPTKGFPNTPNPNNINCFVHRKD